MFLDTDLDMLFDTVFDWRQPQRFFFQDPGYKTGGLNDYESGPCL
jgi:hypothetical protein